MRKSLPKPDRAARLGATDYRIVFATMKPSIKTITVKNLITFLLVMVTLLLVITGVNFRYLSTQAVENHALAVAELVKAGLTAHMKGGIMDKREYYLREIMALNQIKQLHIIRSNEVTLQFGSGTHLERLPDATTREVFETRKPIFILDEFSTTPSIRAIIPYVATPVGSLNCLSCHDVPNNTVLGAVDLQIDVTQYRNQSLMVLAGLFVMMGTFLVLILVNTSRTIQHFVQEPLNDLVDNAQQAYRQHQPLKVEQFESKEFAHVADRINLFNSEIIAHEDLLEKKNHELIDLNDEIESTLRETVYTMGVIEEQRSKETHNHTKRVSIYSQILAKRLGLADRDVELITAAAPLHDIGKLGVPDEVLFKPGELTDEERKVMQNHSSIGYKMLSHSQRDILKAAAVIALQHHEKWNGQGYPQGLKGEEIHIYGRITGLADVFDALSSKRVYKDSWELSQVVEWIGEQRGEHFDPAVVDAFMSTLDEFIAVMRRYPAQ